MNFVRFFTPLSHSPTQIRPTQSPLGKPCVGIVWGAPHSTKPCVGSPTPAPHKVYIIFSSPHNPHAIPHPFLCILPHAFWFWYILVQSPHILPYQRSEETHFVTEPSPLNLHAIPTQMLPSSSPHAKWSRRGPSPRKFRTSRGSVRQGCLYGQPQSCLFSRSALCSSCFMKNISNFRRNEAIKSEIQIQISMTPFFIVFEISHGLR